MRTEDVERLLRQRRRRQLLQLVLTTDVFETDSRLCFMLWDTCLPKYPLAARPAAIADVTLAQLQNDLVRSFHHFHDLDKGDVGLLREKLLKALSRVFERPAVEPGAPPELCYYQGFHEVASVVLVRFGFAHGLGLLERLARSHLREFMAESIGPTHAFSQFVLAVLGKLDPELSRRLAEIEMPPYFFVSWILSWFAHDIDDTRILAKIFNCLAVLPPAAVGYLSALLISETAREEVLAYGRNMDSEEFGQLHTLLKALPATRYHDTLLPKTVALMRKYPPTQIIRGLPELARSVFDADLETHWAAPAVPWRRLGLVLLPLVVALAAAVLYRHTR